MTEPREAVKDELPALYARALELERHGIGLDRLAGELDVPEEAAEAVLELAHRKERRLLATQTETPTAG